MNNVDGDVDGGGVGGCGEDVVGGGLDGVAVLVMV